MPRCTILTFESSNINDPSRCRFFPELCSTYLNKLSDFLFFFLQLSMLMWSNAMACREILALKMVFLVPEIYYSHSFEQLWLNKLALLLKYLLFKIQWRGPKIFDGVEFFLVDAHTKTKTLQSADTLIKKSTVKKSWSVNLLLSKR